MNLYGGRQRRSTGAAPGWHTVRTVVLREGCAVARIGRPKRIKRVAPAPDPERWLEPEPAEPAEQPAPSERPTSERTSR